MCQWDAMFVRLLDPRTGVLLREHLGQNRGATASATRTVRGALRFLRIACWLALTIYGNRMRLESKQV